MEVGEIYKSKRWGDVIIISCDSYKSVTAKFLESGNTDIFTADQIKKGQIRDRKEFLNKRKRVSKSPINPLELQSVYKSNSFGDVIVIEYLSSVNVLIEFINTGNRYRVQKDALLKGLVQDKKERDRKAEEVRRLTRLKIERDKVDRKEASDARNKEIERIKQHKEHLFNLRKEN